MGAEKSHLIEMVLLSTQNINKKFKFLIIHPELIIDKSFIYSIDPKYSQRHRLSNCVNSDWAKYKINCVQGNLILPKFTGEY